MPVLTTQRQLTSQLFLSLHPFNMSQQPEQEPLLAPEVQQTQQTMDTTPDATEPPQDQWADIPEDIMACSTDEVASRIRLIENDIKV